MVVVQTPAPPGNLKLKKKVTNIPNLSAPSMILLVKRTLKD